MRLMLAVALTASVARAAPARDATVDALAKKAAACKFDAFGGFDLECKAYTTWTNEQAAFQSAAAQATLLAMLDDKDVKQRLLATEHLVPVNDVFDGVQVIPVLATKAGIAQVLAAAKRERDKGVVLALAKIVVALDVDKHGLGPELLALLKHPDSNMSTSLATAFELRPGATSAQIAKALLADKRAYVQRNALESVARSQATADQCTLLREWFAAKPKSPELVSIAASSRCRDVMDLAIDWVSSHTDAQLLEAERAMYFGGALAHPCGYKYVVLKQGESSDPNAEQDARRVAKVVKLASRLATSKSVPVREGAAVAFSACADQDTRAAKSLAALAKDPEPEVADYAKRLLARPYSPSFGRP